MGPGCAIDVIETFGKNIQITFIATLKYGIYSIFVDESCIKSACSNPYLCNFLYT